MKKNSIKHARINQEIVRAMSEILRFELKDPRVDPMTSITEADVATDLKTCKLYVSVLGSEEKCDETIRALRGAEGDYFIYVTRRENDSFRNEKITIVKKPVTVLGQSASAASLEESLRNEEIVYMEDRPLSEGCEVMPYSSGP